MFIPTERQNTVSQINLEGTCTVQIVWEARLHTYHDKVKHYNPFTDSQFNVLYIITNAMFLCLNKNTICALMPSLQSDVMKKNDMSNV